MVTLLWLLVLVAHCPVSQLLKKCLLMPPMVEEICSYASYARRSKFLWLLWSKRYPYASYGRRSAFLIGRWSTCAGFLFLYTKFQFFILFWWWDSLPLNIHPSYFLYIMSNLFLGLFVFVILTLLPREPFALPVSVLLPVLLLFLVVLVVLPFLLSCFSSF